MATDDIDELEREEDVAELANLCRRLRADRDNALALIRMRGVPQQRAAQLTHALDVLLTRLDRDKDAHRAEIGELRLALEAACKDLYQAHDELLKVQGVAPHQRVGLDWPEWSGPANTLRWAGRLLGKHVGKSRATAPERITQEGP